MSALPHPKQVSHGIEIVETTHIQALIEQSGKQFEMECFTATERNTPALGAKRIEYLAGRFAAKEAVIKSFGMGRNQGISWLDIEIQRLPSGEPSVILHGKCQEIAEELGITKWLLSISHTSSYAAASAIAVMYCSKNSASLCAPLSVPHALKKTNHEFSSRYSLTCTQPSQRHPHQRLLDRKISRLNYSKQTQTNQNI